MLLQFSVENYRSFKDEVVLSMEASKDKSLNDNCCDFANNKYLKTASIFGSNASGKSNLFKALVAAIMTIRMSSNMQVGEELHYIVPYKFQDNWLQKPTSFEFIFSTKEEIKYIYGFSATRKKVINEYLYKYSTSKKTTIFDRNPNYENEYKFTIQEYKNELSQLAKKNGPNKLFLATSSQWNFKETIEPMMWFMKYINVINTDIFELSKISGEEFEKHQDDSLKEFTLNLLKEADINIHDYSFKVTEQPINIGQVDNVSDNAFNNLEPLSKNTIKNYSTRTFHNIKKGNEKNTKQYPLDIFDESLGTQTLFMLSPILKKAFENGEVICVDEFDKSMHPLLTMFIINLFKNKNFNKNNAQLIISSHAMELLSPRLFRRDQIYFTEKNNNTGVSELFSLDEFSVRANENFRLSYLLGRYGAIPDVNNGEILWQ